MHRTRYRVARLAAACALAQLIIPCGTTTTATTDAAPTPVPTPVGRGSQIPLASGRDGEYEIYSVASDGSGRRNTTNQDSGLQRGPHLVAGRLDDRFLVEPQRGQ